MKRSFPLRMIAIWLAVMFVNGMWLHAAMLSAVAGTLPIEEAKTQKESYVGTLHAGCLMGARCSFCALSASDVAAVGPAAKTLDEGVTPQLVPTGQGTLVVASRARNSHIRAPPQPSLRS